MAETRHNQLIAEAARRVLTPLGVRQRGRSRIWLDDRGWWLIVIEFQPSSWARGTYLNVGAMWLWRQIGHLAFDHGYREEGFQEFRDAADFEAKAAAVAERAAVEVLRLRAQFADLEAVARALGGDAPKDGWGQYHAAIAAALASDRTAAVVGLDALATPRSDDPPWLRDLRAWAREIRGLIDRPTELAAYLDAVVRDTRSALKLPAFSGSVGDRQHEDEAPNNGEDTAGHLENAVFIKRPIEEVFAFVADLPKISLWNYHVRTVTPTSAGTGVVGST